ncbi:SCAI isoform 6, partial [Pan troglodytes]
KRNQSHKEMHCLHPGDLYPFTRKPLFIIVDSSNSVAYKNFTNLFGQPLVCLLSPTAYPKALQVLMSLCGRWHFTATSQPEVLSADIV